MIFLLGCKQENKTPVPDNLVNIEIDSALFITSFNNESVIPLNYYQPLIEWQGKRDSLKLYIVLENQSIQKTVSGGKWRPAAKEFKSFLDDSIVYFLLVYEDQERLFRSPIVKITVSEYSLDEAIIYRLVDPYFDPSKPALIEKLSIEDPQKTQSVKINSACIGCHGYSNAATSFNIKRDGKRRFVYSTSENAIKDYKQKFIGHFSFFSQIIDQRYMLLAANTFGTIDLKNDKNEPFDLIYKEGDIFVFDFEEEKLFPLPGASELDYVEDMPSFSYDGEKIIFSKYKVTDDSIPSMDLTMIDFNGGAGGTPETILKSEPGEYFYFGQFSPDSKWISFCKGNGCKGIFARKTSDIYLMNRQNKKIKKLNLNLDNSMDSWHKWSENSHWLIFSSKRDTTDLTSLYLTYIDDKGNDSPPIKLYGSDSLKVNIPQYIKSDYILPDNTELNSFINEMYHIK